MPNTEPPNEQDLETAARFLAEDSVSGVTPAEKESLIRVATLCRELIPALTQMKPFIDQWMKSQQ